MISVALLGVLVLNGHSDAAPTEIQHMTVSKMRMADLGTSARGYVYNQQQGLPVSYMQYTNHGSGRYYHAPDTVHYVLGASAPVASAAPETAPRYEPTLVAYATAGDVSVKRPYTEEEIANYSDMQLPKYVVISSRSEPRAPYYVPENLVKEQTEVDKACGETGDLDDGNSEEDEGVDTSLEEEENQEDEEEEEEEEEEEGEDEDAGFDFPARVSKGFGKPQADADSSFEDSNSEKYAAQEFSEHSEEGDKGYKSQREFDKAEQSRHDKGNEQGYYDIEGEGDKKRVDNGAIHGSIKEEEKKDEGSSYKEFSYHKKGHKTNGFHNIYHKDEYKKDTDFYDNDHKEGYFNKYEELSKHHKANEGNFKKGKKHSSDFDNQDRGKKGHYDEGHHQSHDQGHDADKNKKSYHANHEDYKTEEGSSSSKST